MSLSVVQATHQDFVQEKPTNQINKQKTKQRFYLRENHSTGSVQRDGETVLRKTES